MSSSPSGPPTSFAHPDAAVAALCDLVESVETETVPWPQAAGRVLAEEVRLDRPSPACDVSAMDGYAVRLAEVARGTLPIRGEVQAGRPAEAMPAGAAVRIFTGAMIPPGAEAVIPREQVIEQEDHIDLPDGISVQEAQYIRRCGENGRPGRVLAEPGRLITPPVLAAIAACGMTAVRVHRVLRVGIVVTGGEVCAVGDTPEPWRLRDSNGPALIGLLAGPVWLESLPPHHVTDQPEAIAQSVTEALNHCDALLLTGGVSAGNYDHVPAVLRGLGLRVVFHKLTIRPGKPVLGAIDAAGRPVLGLPGNPV
jgi:molybdopterin molybdotransferase